MTLGVGIKLTVETQNEYAPSYYEVGNKTACLATGFSRYNATKSHPDNLFSDKTMNATLISGDSLYNQVVLLSDEGKCEPEGTQAENCEDTLEPDPMVNLMALIILGLRLLFLKTIVFNVLMTFRLWISQ
ncbi:M1-specific T cell receptor alpha chain [Dicentrarchus labrax]|uniref:M1-specific T cell receptor alpha chain n=1 Tax=Dicentrarchus labrax TaxID=13489 RepID=UPI0021F52FC1|nr:M1-specific T cell receptor alpha chain [Dicentrarchus labrax]